MQHRDTLVKAWFRVRPYQVICAPLCSARSLKIEICMSQPEREKMIVLQKRSNPWNSRLTLYKNCRNRGTRNMPRISATVSKHNSYAKWPVLDRIKLYYRSSSLAGFSYRGTSVVSRMSLRTFSASAVRLRRPETRELTMIRWAKQGRTRRFMSSAMQKSRPSIMARA